MQVFQPDEFKTMTLIRPFPALRPHPLAADEVLAPPYDVINTEEARLLAQDKPWSFLHISRAEIDLPDDTDPHDPRVYRRAATVFNTRVAEDILKEDSKPNYYVYRLVMGEHTQVGLVAAASVNAYETHRIKRHELTRPDKEDDRVKHIEALQAQTGPVLLFYPESQTLDQLLAASLEHPPVLDVLAHDGIRHSLWVIEPDETIAAISAAVEALPALYIADGHHRSAAAARMAREMRRADGTPLQGGRYEYFLTVSFPHHQMHILEYNRLVADLNGLTVPELLKRIAEHFQVEACPQRYKPAQRGEFGMYLDRQWYKLSMMSERIPEDPVGRLDVSLLHRYLIEPILGIQDPRRDHRIDFVGGIRGLEALEMRVDSGEMALAFALYPTQIDELMAVADAGAIMPPKSTWFEPKLADGLVSLCY